MNSPAQEIGNLMPPYLGSGWGIARRLVALTSRSARLDWIEAMPGWRLSTCSTKSL